MNYDFPTPPDEAHCGFEVTDCSPPADVAINDDHSDIDCTNEVSVQRPRPGPLTAEEQAQATTLYISGLSGIETPPRSQTSSTCPSIASSRDQWSLQSTPSSTYSLSSEPAAAPRLYIRPNGLHPGNWAPPRRPNRKALLVRRARGPSPLHMEQSEEDIDSSHMNTGDTTYTPNQQLKKDCEFIISSPEGIPCTSDPLFAGTEPERRPPVHQPKLFSRYRDYYERFPDIRLVREQGTACASDPCTAVGSPSGSGANSTANSETSSLNFEGHDEMEDVGATPTAHHGSDSSPPPGVFAGVHNGPYLESLQVPSPPCSQYGGAHIMSNARTGLPRWNHAMAKQMASGTFEWQDETTYIHIPRDPYSIDSSESGSKAPLQKDKGLIRKLKKIFWRGKMKNDS